MPNKRMREQCTDRNQGRFLQNFRIFKVVQFSNFSPHIVFENILYHFLAHLILFTNIYGLKSFGFTWLIFQFSKFAENKPIPATTSKIEFWFLRIFFKIFFNAKVMPQFMLIPKHIHFLNLSLFRTHTSPQPPPPPPAPPPSPSFPSPLR